MEPSENEKMEDGETKRYIQISLDPTMEKGLELLVEMKKNEHKIEMNDEEFLQKFLEESLYSVVRATHDQKMRQKTVHDMAKDL